MTRYRIRQPRAFDDYWYEPPIITNVSVCDHEPIFTGLLDADGNEIWRDPEPIGFHSPLDS